MVTLSFDTFEAANNVLSQLPEEARAHGSGVVLTPRLSKDLQETIGYDLGIPDGFAAAAEAADPSAHAPQPTEKQARAECARRITALASEATQRNLSGYMAMLALKPTLTTQEQADVVAFGQAMQWISDMRDRWRSLVAAHDDNWRDDSKWPLAPQAAIDLAARF